ncbi:hypothetical protein H2203_005987 [Taxawa tesnikishii (nom. ined.)]|nr:hypothetical protein H2203_005987 [Dothideales sp. JES 119]
MATILTGTVRREAPLSSRNSSSSEIDPATALEQEKKDPKRRFSVTAVPAHEAPLGIPRSEKRFWFQRDKTYDPDAIATQPSVFDNPDTAKEYQPRTDWENIHRFDPSARWTWGEEHKLIRKIDARIMVFACIMFMALELDRSNLSQALTDNFLNELHLTTNDYNLGNTVFKLSFLCAELPSQLVSKWVGPDRWIPTQMVLWAIVASAQFKLEGRSSFLACRALLGIMQGGFIPDVILYLSYFYKHHELSIRLGFFWTAMSTADILAGFLAYGILHMRGIDGHSGWRWLFLIEACEPGIVQLTGMKLILVQGVFTGVIGLSAYLLMPASPTHTASWFRGKKGWFTEREETIMVNRVIREDPTKGGMHNRQPITPKLLWQSMKDFDLWPLYIIGLMFQIPFTPVTQYLTLSLRGLGFDTFQSNLLAIPYTAIHMLTMMLITYLGEIYGELSLTAMSGQIWGIPFLVYLNVVDTTKVNRWIIWTVTTLMLSYPNAGGIISSNVYRTGETFPFTLRTLHRRP